MKEKILQLSHPLEKIITSQYDCNRVYLEVYTPSAEGIARIILSKREAQELTLRLLKVTINLED